MPKTKIHAELVEADKTVVQEHDAQYRTSDRVTVHARLLSLLTLSFLPLFAHGSGACIPPSFDQMSNASNPSATPLTSVTVSSGSYNQSTKMMQIGTLLKYDTPITPGQSVVISAHFGAYALPTSVPVTAATPHNLVQFSLGPMLLRATNPTSSGHYLSRYGQIELAHYTESYTSGFTTLYRRKLRLNYALYDNSTAPDFTEYKDFHRIDTPVGSSEYNPWDSGGDPSDYSTAIVELQWRTNGDIYMLFMDSEGWIYKESQPFTLADTGMYKKIGHSSATSLHFYQGALHSSSTRNTASNSIAWSTAINNWTYQDNYVYAVPSGLTEARAFDVAVRPLTNASPPSLTPPYHGRPVSNYSCEQVQAFGPSYTTQWCSGNNDRWYCSTTNNCVGYYGYGANSDQAVRWAQPINATWCGAEISVITDPSLIKPFMNINPYIRPTIMMWFRVKDPTGRLTTTYWPYNKRLSLLRMSGDIELRSQNMQLNTWYHVCWRINPDIYQERLLTRDLDGNLQDSVLYLRTPTSGDGSMASFDVVRFGSAFSSGEVAFFRMVNDWTDCDRFYNQDVPSSVFTDAPTTSSPIQPTISPVSAAPTTSPLTSSPSSQSPTSSPSTGSPSSQSPTGPPTSAPTLSPTLSPTSSSPTISPTTSNPVSISPTVPTQCPSISPSRIPSTSPTQNPTISPTMSPASACPSTSPTSTNPTTRPSQNPTTNPSAGPTQNPTTNPSAGPTQNPTGGPSLAPSRNPTSKSPVTLQPSVAPATLQPSVAPVTGSPNTINPTVYNITGNGDSDILSVQGSGFPIFVAVLCLAVLCCCCILFFLCKRRKRKKKPRHSSIVLAESSSIVIADIELTAAAAASVGTNSDQDSKPMVL